MDLNVDGMVDTLDAETLVTKVFGATPGDFNLDGMVDGRDFLTWQRHAGTVSAGRYDQGDADFNGVIDGADLAVWQQAYSATEPLALNASANAVPEPSALGLCGMGGLLLSLGTVKRNSMRLRGNNA